jgi:hypothetical protein
VTTDGIPARREGAVGTREGRRVEVARAVARPGLGWTGVEDEGQACRGGEGGGAAWFGLDWGGRRLRPCDDSVTLPSADKGRDGKQCALVFSVELIFLSKILSRHPSDLLGESDS